jgi:hypothetical protein
MSTDEFAFPLPTQGIEKEQNGMTLRDYFAAAALQGLLANTPDKKWLTSDYALMAYELANEMLEERTI